MRILYVVHGFPPRECAGTEQHTADLAVWMRAAGHVVHTVAATRAPGHPQYAVLEAPGVTRIVNNITSRALADEERDPTIDRIVADMIRNFRPDVVHVQHLQFLSASAPISAPYVVTLHDQWMWCAAGGLGLLPSGAPCDGPEPDQCARCHVAWAPVPGRAARGLVRAAATVAPLVSPDRLHRLYQRIPDLLRAPVRRGVRPLETPVAAAARNARLLHFTRRARARFAPSQWLARRGEKVGAGQVEVVRHGVQPGRPHRGGGGGLFLGTISHHKGPDLVVEAWRRAFPTGGPPLRVHGPLAEPGLVVEHPVGPPLDREGVAAALQEADVLMLGSRWPENAPLVVLEARAAGCPVIAPAVGGIPEILEDGVDGRLVPPDDPGSMAAALKDVLSKKKWHPRTPPTPGDQAKVYLEHYGRIIADDA